MIYFELRTLFDLKIKNDKRYYLYLNEEQEIKSRMRNIITFILEKNKISNARYCYIFEKNKISKCRDVIISFEKSTVNENRLLNACNRAHNCQNDDFEIMKKKKNTFSKT